MAYTKSGSLISRPIRSGYDGIQEGLGLSWGDVGGGVGKVVDFFGSGLKAQGAQEALAAQLAAQNAALAAQQGGGGGGGGGGIPTTYLVVGGLALVGVLVFAMRGR